jgi:hypothetical protein
MGNQGLPSPQQQQVPQPVQPPLTTTNYGDPYALGYGGTSGSRMLARDSQPLQQQQQQQQQLGGKYERKRVLAEETNPIEPNISDPLFSVKRTHFHPPGGPTTSSSRV